MKWYPEASTAEVREILQNHTTNDDSGRYYFAGAANYNESYHVVYLLARSNNLNDNKLYVTILHTLTGNIQEEVVAPGESKKVEYSGTGGTTHAPIFTNYDGTSVSIGLDGVEKGEFGMVVGFAYGYDTGIYGEPASNGNGNGFMMTPMPTKTTTTIHYIDQATGDELAVPKSFEGVAYQKYTITGEAPTIDGYTLKQSPKTTGYISPYKVGESYDFRLDKHVVIKQTVIDSQGLIRVTAYYDGEAINNTTRYLGNMANVNDHYSFISHGKSYTYINQITSTNDGIVYYYAKDGSEDKSEVRVHYIDVTGNKNSIFVPGDGKEVATDKISGKLGENYNYNVNLPTDYNLATNQANTVNGTYTINHHDEYVYVVKKTSAELDPTVKDKTKVDDPKKLTADEKKEVEDNIRHNNPGLPEGTTIDVGDNGDTTISYPDNSVDTIPGNKLVEEKTSAEKLDPTVQAKTKVDDPKKLTADEKKEVEDKVTEANKDKFPEGTEVTVDDDGTVTINYPDGSQDTIPGDQVVEAKTDADKTNPTVPGTKVEVKDPNNLTDEEKQQVKESIENANKDQFPEGTQVTIGNDGTATITYPDQTKSTDTIQGSDLVRPETDAEKITPKVPSTKEPVADPSHLTEPEKDKVKKNVEEANKGNFPDGTKVDVGDDGTATITYPDQTKSTDTIQGSDLVRPETDAEKITPKVPSTKEPVADPSHLTKPEKDKVKKNVEDANKDKFPAGTEVTVGDDGTATITYPDQTKSTDTIQGSDLVRPETDAEKITPKVPSTKEPVADPSHLTEPEKDQVKKNVEEANKGNFPEGTTVDVGDNGTATITYPDGSKDTIPGDKVVEGKSDAKSDAEKITPKDPGTKEPVADLSHLTEPEKDQIKKNVEEANKGNFPEGTTVDVGDNGTATITYPDGSKDTIPGDKVVEGKSDAKSDAEKITPKDPGTKEPVADPSHLTEDEKDQVKTNVTNANKDNLPSGSQVTVGNDGTTTVTYPDGSKDTIPGSDLVRQSNDADKTTPSVPETKVPVTNPSQLTDSEKEELSNNLEKLNPGTVVTIADDGTATLTYPDGSTNIISGSQLVTAKGNGNTTNSNVKVTPTNTNNKINKDNNSLGKNTANAKAGELPQTGETNDSQKLSVIGMALMGILGLFGLGKKRKKD